MRAVVILKNFVVFSGPFFFIHLWKYIHAWAIWNHLSGEVHGPWLFDLFKVIYYQIVKVDFQGRILDSSTQGHKLYFNTENE